MRPPFPSQFESRIGVQVVWVQVLTHPQPSNNLEQMPGLSQGRVSPLEREEEFQEFLCVLNEEMCAGAQKKKKNPQGKVLGSCQQLHLTTEQSACVPQCQPQLPVIYPPQPPGVTQGVRLPHRTNHIVLGVPRLQCVSQLGFLLL